MYNSKLYSIELKNKKKCNVINSHLIIRKYKNLM